MGVGKTNKRKGSNAERHYTALFRELGFPFCQTARFVSKRHDNAKVDLVDIPFNIQVKAGKQTSMNPGKELLFMESNIKTMFPVGDEIHKRPLLLFHYKEVEEGGYRRLPKHEIVYMSLQQFELFKRKNKKLEFDYHKEFRYEMESQFKTIVGMTLEVFINEVIKKQYKKHGNSSK